MLFAAVLVAALVGIARVRGAEQGKSCKLVLQDDLDPALEPLVLAVKQTGIRNQRKVEQLEMARPQVEGRKGVIPVEHGQQLLLACTGPKNYNRVTREQTAYVTCEDGQLKINNRKLTKETSACFKTTAESSLRVTDDSCGSGDDTGIILQLGFELDDSSFFPLVDVCHNIEHSVTLYSTHALYGQSLKGSVKSSERKKFSRGPKGLFPRINPDSAYPKKSQVKAFDKILGSKQSSLYLNTTSFLARGHLAPDADFIYNSGQLMTYYYANVAPQWQAFNAGNWLVIENAVRDLAVKEEETINVFTGTYGILQLANENGDQRYIYLEPTNKLIPVPAVYWKLVQHPLTKSCTVAIGTNNVFLSEAPTPICKKASPDGWPTLEDLTKGYTYYCDYDSFVETVTYAPTLDCKDLFEFPAKTE